MITKQTSPFLRKSARTPKIKFKYRYWSNNIPVKCLPYQKVDKDHYISFYWLVILPCEIIVTIVFINRNEAQLWVYYAFILLSLFQVLKDRTTKGLTYWFEYLGDKYIGGKYDKSK